MGQIKKLIPRNYRDKLFEQVDSRLPDDSFVRKQFANGVSATGAALVVAGSYIDSTGRRALGMTLRGAGEAADDIDGDVARRLNTSGKSGALVDATLDKIKIAAEVFTLWKHASVAASPLENRRGRLSVIAGKHTANAALNVYLASVGAESESSNAGKINMWADGLAIGFWGISDAANTPTVKHAADTLGNISFGAGLAIGGVATFGYAQEVVQAVGDRAKEEPFTNCPQAIVQQAALSGYGLDS